MEIRLNHNGSAYSANLSKPLDLSLPLKNGTEGVNCFYAPPVEYTPYESGDFIGSIEHGSPVNFLNVKINPHGNGTHTECVGHIASGKYIINESLQNFHYISKLVSVLPTKAKNGDRVVYKEQLDQLVKKNEAKAIVIRTLPNDENKRQQDYSGTNPPYLHHKAVSYLVACGIEHLLIDLPSVDREQDEGKLLSHKAFWKYPDNLRTKATISELIFVNDKIKDGLYLLNLQIASFEIDASPSKPILYELTPLEK